MQDYFRTMDAVLQSGLAATTDGWNRTEPGTDRVLKSTKLEDMIYGDLRRDDSQMEAVEAVCGPKLATFPALARDMFQSMYSLNVRYNDNDTLTPTARKINRHILNSVIDGDDYATMKSICEGRELPAFDAAVEFASSVSGNLDELLHSAAGDKNSLSTLEKLEEQREQLAERLQDLLRQHHPDIPDSALEQDTVKTANQLQSKTRQVEAVDKMVSDNLIKNKAAVAAILAPAIQAASEKAQETADAILAWGNDPADPKQVAVNREILARVQNSPLLSDITKQLGRLREIFDKAKRDSYAYGRGEKYDIEPGNDLQRVVSSEFALLALPETATLFYRKYLRKGLKQYRRRERIAKGQGDVIVCLDESGSTEGEPAAWGKAVALTMLRLAAESGRKYALIHFGGKGSYKTDLFLPKQYSPRDVLNAAETFLGGGTDYATPLAEAIRLMEREGFENADIVFITDGECVLPTHTKETLAQHKSEKKFTITGILMDDADQFDFSLQSFCEKVYRTSELSGESIGRRLLADRAL